LPKTGSDGVGYALAQALGHRIVDTTPALVPLVLDGDRHVALSGRTHLATLRLLVGGTCVVALTGSLLWTHVGVSGPVALDLSRHWHRAVLETDCETPAASGGVRRVGVSVSVCPWETHESLDAWLLTQERDRSRSHVATVLSSRLPAAVADLWVERAGIAADTPMAHLARSDRRRLVSSLLDTPLEVRGSRGYNYAEVTAGGVPLDEVDSRSMESRACPGLFLVGEILDVDGRLGGFNFQWAWSSAWVAGQALGQQSA
jgi:predicted Rossmann fold flavoprotein